MDPFNPNTAIRNDHFVSAVQVPVPGPSAYLGGATEMQAGQPEAEALAVAALDDVAAIGTATLTTDAPLVNEVVLVAASPIYPAGNVVDFNKPFVIHDINNEDIVHTDPKIIAILSGNSYPVVILSINEDGEELVNQFDTDGDELNRNWEVKNVVPEVFPRTVYILIEKDRRALLVDSEVYFSEADALKDSAGELIAIVPIVIDADTFRPRHPLVIDNDDQAFDDQVTDLIETESEAEIEEEGDDQVEQLPEGAVYVNGTVRKPGDKVNTNRTGRGHRVCTIIKTRSDPFKSLYVQADNGNEEPYWARNKSVYNY